MLKGALTTKYGEKLQFNYNRTNYSRAKVSGVTTNYFKDLAWKHVEI